MAVLTWDADGARHFETGVSKGVLYPRTGTNGAYDDGIAWNGLTSITESPSGAEATPLYADNIKYLSMMSAEEFGATIEAYTYPDEFAVCDGSAEVGEVTGSGVTIGQQARVGFGLCYRTEIGNDVDGNAHGYRLHLLYGCMAAPSERAYQTINDSPEAITFSWEVTTTPIAVTDFLPTSCLIIDSTKIASGKLTSIEALLYGTDGTPGTTASLPTPDEIIAILDAA
jgi:hypothetical protein